MRARYSAFVTQNADFLRASWHPATCPATLQFNPDQRWLGLKILDTDQGGAEDDEGEVLLAARYKIYGKDIRKKPAALRGWQATDARGRCGQVATGLRHLPHCQLTINQRSSVRR